VESSAGLNAETIRAQGVRGTPDVSALASLDQNKLCVLVWHYHDDDVPGPAAAISLNLSGLPLPSNVKVTEYRIDQEHSNSFAAWRKMGSPQSPSPDQYAELEKAGGLARIDTPHVMTWVGGVASLPVILPRQAVSLFVLEWR
jgi:xylan 1,4-beta-xylosidase